VSHEGIVRWWLVLPVCLLGVLSGDMVLYWVGRHWGAQVLNWRLVRLVVSSAREQWLKAANAGPRPRGTTSEASGVEVRAFGPELAWSRLIGPLLPRTRHLMQHVRI
jgi:hypothetical protein